MMGVILITSPVMVAINLDEMTLDMAFFTDARILRTNKPLETTCSEIAFFNERIILKVILDCIVLYRKRLFFMLNDNTKTKLDLTALYT